MSSIQNFLNDLLPAWLAGNGHIEDLDGSTIWMREYLGTDECFAMPTVSPDEEYAWHWLNLQFEDVLQGELPIYVPAQWGLLKTTQADAVVGKQEKINLIAGVREHSDFLQLLDKFDFYPVEGFCHMNMGHPDFSALIIVIGAENPDAPHSIFSLYRFERNFFISKTESYTPEELAIRIKVGLISDPWHIWRKHAIETKMQAN